MLYFRTFDLFLCFSISVGRFLGNLGYTAERTDFEVKYPPDVK